MQAQLSNGCFQIMYFALTRFYTLPIPREDLLISLYNAKFPFWVDKCKEYAR